VSVVSARATFETQYPGDPFMWKRAAFEHLLTKERHFPASTGLNLVVFGDQFPEIDAAHYVAWLRGDSTELKAVKLKEAPTVLELVGQLRRVERELPRIVNDSDDRSRGVVCRHLAPELKQCSSGTSEGVKNNTAEISPNGVIADLKEKLSADPITGLREICQLFL